MTDAREVLRALRDAAARDLADCDAALVELGRLELAGDVGDAIERRLALVAWHREARVRLATLLDAIEAVRAAAPARAA